MDQYLIINRRSDFARGMLVNLQFDGPGLRLESAADIARGCAYLPRLDGGQREFLWTRLCVTVSDFEGFVRIGAFATDVDLMPGERVTVEEYLQDPYTPQNIKRSAVDPLYTTGFVGGGDVMLRLRGRYLYVKVELVSTGGRSPVLSQVRARVGGDHMMDYLPAVYQRNDGDGFLYRYLSLFDAVVKDLEERIEHFDENLDYDKATGGLLRYLAGWVGVDGENMDDETLRSVMRTAVTDYERAQTPEGIKRLTQRLTGVRPILVEHFRVEPMQRSGADTALYVRLFGREENRFHLLLPERCFPSQEAAQDFLDRVAEQTPADVEAELVLLKESIYLDRHTYLGVNSVISGHTDAAIDRKAAIEYDTVIGGNLK